MVGVVIVCTAAWAEDEVNPKTEWKPVLESRAAVELFAGDGYEQESDGGVLDEIMGDAHSRDTESQAEGAAETGIFWGYLDLSARAGLEVRRRALSARITIAADSYWAVRRAESLSAGAEAGAATFPYLSEAWVDLNPAISESLETSFRIGRQPVQFHDGRIVGRNDLTLRGDFPDVARVLLRGDPLQIEVIGGADLDPTEELRITATELNTERRWVSSVSATPVLFARAGLSRENPATKWVVDAVFVTAAVAEDERDLLTSGLYTKADFGRIRSRLDVYIQPYALAPAWMGGAKVGYAFGDDARVVLGMMGEGRSAEGGGTLAFTRPWRNTGDDFGQLDLYEPGAIFGLDGVADFALFTEAKIVPSLRIDGQAHLLSALESSVKQAEVDADMHWWFTPHVHLRVRSAVNIPLANPDEVRSLTSISLDLAI